MSTTQQANPMRQAGMECDDVEALLLGVIVADAVTGGYEFDEICADVATRLTEKDFRLARHRAAYASLLDFAGRGIVPTFEMLDADLRARYDEYEIGHLLALTRNTDVVGAYPTRFHEACRMVKDAADRRWLYALAERMAAASGARGESPTAVMEQMRREMDTRTMASAVSEDEPMERIGARFRENVAQWRATPFQLRGISTGIKAIDDKTSGARKGHLWVIGGRSSMGKTAMSLTMLRHAAFEVKEGHFVAMVSLEMSKDELFLRMAAMECGESVEDIERGDPKVDWERLDDAVTQLEMLPIRIFDAVSANNRANRTRGRITVEEIRRLCQAWRRDGVLDMLIVDYVELVSAPEGTEKLPREERLSGITKALKALAEEMQAPVIALSQLNRGTEDSDSRIPTLANIRGSDAIGNDAHVVIFPVRWDYYKERGQKVPDDVKDRPVGYTDLMIAKNRNGRVGLVPAFYLASQMRFCDFDPSRNCPVDYRGNVIRQIVDMVPPRHLRGA